MAGLLKYFKSSLKQDIENDLVAAAESVKDSRATKRPRVPVRHCTEEEKLAIVEDRKKRAILECIQWNLHQSFFGSGDAARWYALAPAEQHCNFSPSQTQRLVYSWSQKIQFRWTVTLTPKSRWT